MLERLLLRWLINVASLFVVIYLVPGVKSDKIMTVVAAGLVLGLVNALFRPVFLLLTFPITVLTLGLFTLFINGFCFFLVSKMVPGFHVESYWWAFLAAILFSVVSFAINLTLGSER
jgi:putative membrane protein